MIGAEVFFIGGPFGGEGEEQPGSQRELWEPWPGGGSGDNRYRRCPAGLRHGPATAPERGRGGRVCPARPGESRQRAGREAAWGRRRGLPADRTVIHGPYRRLPRGFYGRGGGRRFLFSSDGRGGAAREDPNHSGSGERWPRRTRNGWEPFDRGLRCFKIGVSGGFGGSRTGGNGMEIDARRIFTVIYALERTKKSCNGPV